MAPYFRPLLLSHRDRAAIADLGERRRRRVRARTDIISEGDRPRVVNMILSGWACRYKQLPDGRRQMLSLFLPGDICDANVFMLDQMDHSVGTLTDVELAEIAPADFSAAITGDGRLAHFLWCEDLRTIAMQREWTLSIGQRTARERIAHLFCETFYRLRHIGLVTGDRCEFPLTQNDLADATGLTAIHVNRMVQELRAAGLIELDRPHMRIPDLKALEDEAMFDPTYLHFAARAD